MAKIVRYLNPERSDQTVHFPGVPLRDLTDEDWNRLTPRQQEEADASDLYRKTAPRATSSGGTGGDKAAAAAEPKKE